MLESHFVCRVVVHPALYIGLRFALMAATILPNIDEPDPHRKQSMYFTEAYYDKFPRKLRKHPRLRRPLDSDDSRTTTHRYSDDIEYRRAEFFGSSDSDSSTWSLYHARLPRDYIPKGSKRMGMNPIRPRKWLSSLLHLEFLDVLKKRIKALRKNQDQMEDQKPTRQQSSRIFVVDPPKESRTEKLPQRQSATRTHPVPREMDSPSTNEPQGSYAPNQRSHGDHLRDSGTQQPWAHRPCRERTPVMERVPLRPGRRTSPVQPVEVEVMHTMPPRERGFDWGREVDRRSMNAFRHAAMPQITRPEDIEDRARQRNSEIPVPAQGGFSRRRDAPEPSRIIHRSPRPLPTSSAPQTSGGVAVEERNPLIEERRPRPVAVQQGRRQISVFSAHVLGQAQSRPTVEIVENRETRTRQRAGRRIPSPYQRRRQVRRPSERVVYDGESRSHGRRQ